MSKLLKFTLSKPGGAHRITFFETPAGTFDRVDHHGDSVTWQHFITLSEVGYTIYSCATLGYTITEEGKQHEKQTDKPI